MSLLTAKTCQNIRNWFKLKFQKQEIQQTARFRDILKILSGSELLQPRLYLRENIFLYLF